MQQNHPADMILANIDLGVSRVEISEQVTSNHWESAAEFSVGGNRSANLTPQKKSAHKKTPAKAGVDGCGLPEKAMPMTPTGLEPVLPA